MATPNLFSTATSAVILCPSGGGGTSSDLPTFLRTEGFSSNPTALLPQLRGGAKRLLLVVLGLASGDLCHRDGSADHVGRSLLAFRAFGALPFLNRCV